MPAGRIVRRVLRIARRVTLIAAALIALVLAVALIVVHTDWGRNRIRERIVEGMNAKFPGGVQIGALDGSVVGDAVLRDVVIHDRQGRDAIKISRIELNLGLGALLHRTIQLEELTARGVVIEIHKPAGGPLNLADMIIPSREPPGWDVELQKIRIADAAITLDVNGRIAHLDAIALGGELTLRRDRSADVELDVKGTWRERATAFSLVTSPVHVTTGGEVTTDKLTASLDGFSLIGTNLRYAGPTDAAGVVVLNADKGAIQRFLPEHPANPAVNVTLAIEPTPDRSALDVAVNGSAGKAALIGRLAVVPNGAGRIGGIVHATGANVADFSPTALRTEIRVTVLVGLGLDAPIPGGSRGVAGVIAAVGGGTIGELTIDQLYTHTVIVDKKISWFASGAAPGDARARIDAEITREDKGAFVIDRAHLVGSVDQIGKILPDALISGAVSADLVVRGTVSNRLPLLTFDGKVAGRGLRRQGVSIATADLTLDALQLDLARPNRPTGAATLVAAGATIDGQAVPTTTATLRSERGGNYRVAVASSGEHLGSRGAPWSFDADALVHPGDDDRSFEIHLGDYALRTRGVAWAGAGGTVAVTPAKVEVAGIAGQVDGGTFALDGTMWRGGRNQLDGKVRTAGVHLEHVDEALDLQARGIGPLHGVASLAAEIHRKGGAITGTIAGSVKQLAVRDGADPLDVTVDLSVEQTRIVGSVNAAGKQSGDLAIAVDVEPPRDVSDARAWARLERRAIRTATIHARGVDVVAIAHALGVPPPLEGQLTADLRLGPDGSVGQIHATDVVVPGVPGMIDLDADLDLDDFGVVAVKARASLREIMRGTIDATVRLPTRPFDYHAWAALDITALRGGTIAIDEVTIDDRIALRLGLGTWRGKIGGAIEVAEGLTGIQARAVVRGVTGGAIQRPVDVVVDGTLAKTGATATAAVSIDGLTVLTADASAPIDPDRLAVGGIDAVVDVPITGKVTLVPTELAPLIRTFGEDQRVAGTARGEVTLAGTIGAPTAAAAIVVENLGGKRSRVKQLRLDAGYAAGKLTGKLTGDQEGGGSLVATAAYDRAAPDKTRMTLKAQRFQIAPLIRLIPNVIGVRGVLEADFAVTGLDPRTATAAGVIRIRQAQIPIVDEIGAITGGAIDLAFSPGGARLSIVGQVESGDVELDATAKLDGLLPRTMTLDATVRNLTLITTMQPRVAGSLHADVALEGDHWKVDARVRDGRVVIPDEDGQPLHPASPPADIVFIENGTIRTPPRAAARQWLRSRPSHPFLLIALRIEPIAIVSKQLRGDVGGKLDIAAGDDGVSIDGQIEARRGEVMVFDRRYSIERAVLAFDGPPDPILDIRIQHDFSELSMQVGIRGRLSDPELELTSSPSIYTEGQLLGYLLGGSPGGAGQDSREVLTGAAAVVASQTVGGFLTRRLPVRVDVLRFEPATASSSAAFVMGKWVTAKVLVLLRSRIEPRIDENTAETEVEWWLGHRVMLDGTGGDKGVFGLDLLWTKRW